MKAPTIRKGMVLAAGLGTRLLPITEKYPKPLVPVLNVPNILHSLFLMKRAGILDVIINLHHLPDHIERYLGDGKQWGMRIAYSREKQLLGTGGGLKKAEPFFDGEPFVLVNCDFISNVDLTPMIAEHLRSGATATMVLHQDAELQPFYSKVGVDAQGKLCQLPRCSTAEPTRSGLFTGIHLLAPEALRYLREEPSGINEVLYPTLMKDSPGKARGVFTTNAYWYDTGERTTLWNASMQLLERMESGDDMLREFLMEFGGYEERQKGVWLARGERLPEGMALMPPLVIGLRCRFGNGVILGPKSLIGDDSEVADGAQVTEFVALGAARIPAQSVARTGLQFEALTLPTAPGN